jgi:PAS domain S-box-containing protein
VRRSGYLLAITVVLGLLTGAPDSVCQQRQSERQALPTLTTAHDAHSMTSEEAARNYPVHLRGVVTYYDPYIDPHYPTLWVSDSTGGIYVVLSSVPAVPFKAGDLVEITGTSAAGGYAPVVKDSEARVIGKSPLPSPASITFGQVLTGAEDGRWVEVEGVVYAVRESGNNIDLDLALSDGTVLATTVKEAGVDYDSLIDAKVRLRGNQAPLFNHQGAMTGSYIVFPDRAQVVVMEPPPAHPFTLPISPVSGLLRFSPKPAWDHRVHIRGIVTLAWPGRLLCLQEGAQGLCAQTDQITPVNPGELADVIGFPIMGAITPALTRATYKAAGFQTPVPAAVVTADQALHGNHDAELVELTGQLVGQDEASSDPNIVLSSQDLVFSALLPAHSGAGLPVWKNGTTLKVVGICSMKGGSSKVGATRDGLSIPESFRILLRSPEDVVVMKTPSWWTPSHAISMLGLAVALILVTAAIRDITKRRESEARYRGLLEAAPDGMVVVNQYGAIVLLNTQAERQFGYSRDELLGQEVKNIIPEGFAERLIADRTRTATEALAQQIGTGIELAGRRKDRSEFPIEIMLSPLESGGETLITATIRDISVRKEAEANLVQKVEELHRSNADLDQFASFASHDLQEPLRMVAGYTNLLARRYKGKLDSDADEFIAFAVDGVNRMQRLIEDLLLYSRVGTGGADLRDASSEEALRQALKNLHGSLEESGALVTHDPLPIVQADQRQLTQLFQNLVGNAIKYQSPGIPRVHISATRNEKKWMFSVKDNGLGIEPQNFEKIFVMFKRLHKREEFTGTGIGLAICKKIVERHGGQISVESQPGHGSTFHFALEEGVGKA